MNTESTSPVLPLTQFSDSKRANHFRLQTSTLLHYDPSPVF